MRDLAKSGEAISVVLMSIGVGQGTSRPSMDGPVCRAGKSVGLRIQ